MKCFFEAYVHSEKLAPLVREIDWSQNLTILELYTDPLEVTIKKNLEGLGV